MKSGQADHPLGHYALWVIAAAAAATFVAVVFLNIEIMIIIITVIRNT